MLRAVFLLGLLVVGACVASVATPSVEAQPTCSPIHDVPDDPGAAVACIQQDVPCLPRPCG